MMLFLVTSAAAQPAPQVEYFPDPSPTAPYSTAVRFGDVLFLSGQTGESADGTLPAGFEAQAKQTMENIGIALRARKLGFDDVFKCTVMLENMADWPKFNTIYVPYFKAGRLPARSAIGADGLAGGALIELECWARAGDVPDAHR
jgi:reactive intermediate/imine deaminase